MQDRPRWPTVIGTIGMVIGIVLLIDTVDDVMTLQWTAEDWRMIFAPNVADLIARSMPPVAWRVFSTAAQTGLAALLIVGSIGLRRRRPAGVSLCKLWAWLAIVWVVVLMIRGAVWLRQLSGELPALGAVSSQAYALAAVVLAVAILLAFPVFLLVWLSKPAVRAEYDTWAA